MGKLWRLHQKSFFHCIADIFEIYIFSDINNIADTLVCLKMCV